MNKDLLDLSCCAHFTKVAREAKNLYCMGIDGPTASGKTIFAKILSEHLTKTTNKTVLIVPLDGLLVERVMREDALSKIKAFNIPFSLEAEVHMAFEKYNNLFKAIKEVREGKVNQQRVLVSNLYNRQDSGKCTAKLSVDLTPDTILIFEGHYTSRPPLIDILDDNIILLAETDILLRRKKERVKNYRGEKDTESYFKQIDVPSFLDNFYRFYSSRMTLIDNSSTMAPKVISFSEGIQLFIKVKKEDYNYVNLEAIKKYIFGQHASKNRSMEEAISLASSIVDSFLTNKYNINQNLEESLETKNTFVKLLSEKKNFSGAKLSYRALVELKTNLSSNYSSKIYLCLERYSAKSIGLIGWNGGVFLVESDGIKKVINKPLRKEENLEYFFPSPIFHDNEPSEKQVNQQDGELSFCDIISRMSSSHKHSITLGFMGDEKESSFLQELLYYSGYLFLAQDDGFALVSSRDLGLISKFEEARHILAVFGKVPEYRFDKEKVLDDVESKTLYESKFVKIIAEQATFKEPISSVNVSELCKLISSQNYRIRKAIYLALKEYHLSDDKEFNNKIRSIYNTYVPYFPTTMTRLYLALRISRQKGSVLATNIYDITENSADISAYLQEASSKSYPLILQASLNAIGQREKIDDNTESYGYLKPKEGCLTFVQSISNSINSLFLESKERFPLFYGVGLDHVDVRGNKPEGRSKRFTKEALGTNIITHLTLDGSELFKPKNREIDEINDSYIKVFMKANEFIGYLNIENVDLEYCTGELNYIGSESVPHLPRGEEIACLPRLFDIANNYENDFLRKKCKLFVANLGTIHHGVDDESKVDFLLPREWLNAVTGSKFLSPVLHGTTNSSDRVFINLAACCKKINIAGSFLKVFLDSLPLEAKKQIKYSKFDENSKYLCSKLYLIRKIDKWRVVPALRYEYRRLTDLCKAPSLSKLDMDALRKPTYFMPSITKRVCNYLWKLTTE